MPYQLRGGPWMLCVELCSHTFAWSCALSMKLWPLHVKIVLNIETVKIVMNSANVLYEMWFLCEDCSIVDVVCIEAPLLRATLSRHFILGAATTLRLVLELSQLCAIMLSLMTIVWRIQMLCVEARWLSLLVNIIGILLDLRPLISLRVKSVTLCDLEESIQERGGICILYEFMLCHCWGLTAVISRAPDHCCDCVKVLRTHLCECYYKSITRDFVVVVKILSVISI